MNMKSYGNILFACVCAVVAASAEGVSASGRPRTEAKVVAPKLIFHVPFDGSAEAVRAQGEKAPRRAEGLAFVEGKFGQAVRLTGAAKSVLEYVAKDNLVPERGTVSLWFRSAGAGKSPNADGDELEGGAADEWTHFVTSWDEAGVKVYVNGRRVRRVDDGENPRGIALRALKQLTFNQEVVASFRVGCGGASRPFADLLDDLRVYSAPLAPEQVREIWRRGQVIEFTAYGRYALADLPNTLTVKATSPGGCDISELKYCICDRTGKVLARYRNAVGSRVTELIVNLPAGDYELKATDGTWFYGALPYTVLPKENPYAPTGGGAKMHEPKPAPPPSGLVRAWHDFKAFNENRLGARQDRMARKEQETDGERRMVVRFFEAPEREGDFADEPFEEDRPEKLNARIDRTAAGMKSAGENLLAYSGARWPESDILSAWYAKFDHEGLFLVPVVKLDMEPGPKVRRRVAEIIDALADQGEKHPSFKGVCLRLTCHEGELGAEFRAKVSRKLAARRPDLKLWLNDMIPTVK